MFCVNDFGGGGRYCPDVPKAYYTHFIVYIVFIAPNCACVNRELYLEAVYALDL